MALVSSTATTSFLAPALGSTFTSPDTHLLDWNVAESQMYLVLAPLSHLVLSGLSSPLNEADHLAHGILHAGVARFHDIAQLMLRGENINASSSKDNDLFQLGLLRLEAYLAYRIPRDPTRGPQCFLPR